MNLSISPIKNNQQPIFGTAKIYRELKQVPTLTCACCGEKMVTPEAFANIFKTISQPLSKLIKKGFFNNFIKDIPAIAILTNFAVNFPKDNLDKILCNKDNKKKFSDACAENGTAIKNIARSELRSASLVLKRIAPFRDYFPETEKEIYDLFCAYAKEYPRKSLSEIVQLDEVQSIHSDIYKQTKTKINKLNQLHLDNIEKLLKKENNKLNVENIIQTIKKIIECRNAQEYRDFQLTKYLESTLTENASLKTIKKILTEANFLQGRPNGADYFFIRAKKRNYNDFTIIQQIFYPRIATFEHIKPKVKGGSDSKNNGIIFCQDCNSKRQSIPYAEFIQYNPQMPYNTQKQILQISDLILHGRLNGQSKDWPIKIASTLYKNSDGKINIELDSYLKKANKKYGKDVAKRSEEIAVAKKELAKNKNEIKLLEEQLQNLYNSTYTLRDEISTKSSENNEEKALLELINKKLIKD